jgi:triacylglycerol lipase
MEQLSTAMMALCSVLTTLMIIFSVLLCVSTASVVPLKANENFADGQSNGTISRKAFNILEELSRIVDISYCIGNTGVRKPFECLSHCREFPGFELITVSSEKRLRFP